MNVLIRKHKYLLAYSLLFPISYLLLNYNKIFFNQVVYGMPTNILMTCLTCLFLLFEILYLFDTTFDFMNLKYEIEIRKPNLLRDLIIKKSLISDIFLAVIQLISWYLFSHHIYIGFIMIDKAGLLFIYLLLLKIKTTNDKKVDSIIIFIFMIILHLCIEYLYGLLTIF